MPPPLPLRVAQEGGSHYQAELQHWDVMEEHDVEYLLATASKYVIRWRRKGGAEDLRKAISYVRRKLVETPLVRRFVPVSAISALSQQYGMGTEETRILLMLHTQLASDLPGAVTALRELLAEAENQPAYDANDRQS